MEKASGADYRGCQTQTHMGYTCQRWDAQSPHAHGYTSSQYPNGGLDANYCRNPAGDAGIWCYTTDPAKRWDYCAPLNVGQPPLFSALRPCLCAAAIGRALGPRSLKVPARAPFKNSAPQAPTPPPPSSLGVCIWMHLVNGTGNSPSAGRPTPGVRRRRRRRKR